LAKTPKMKTVLICPLDWGLGHTTRCIPLIASFLRNQWHVIVGCEIPSAAHSLLCQEFPSIQFVNLPGYHIQYTQKTAFFALKMAIQLPRIFFAIKKENNWLQSIINKFDIDLVVSDNRYGLYTKKCSCIFITHQLRIKASNRFFENILQKINYHFINQFSSCWVPDFSSDKENTEKGGSIAGTLSHPVILPKIPVQYLGILNRTGKLLPNFNKYKFLILLSGPEPQRSLLEEKLLQWIRQINDPVLLARGRPGSIKTIKAPINCTVVNHLTLDELETAFHFCEYVIARSGYTTVMEILARKKKSILIPTPGQTEQEYLATHLMERQWAYTFSQTNNDYLDAIHAGERFTYAIPVFPTINLDEIVKNSELLAN